MCKPEFLLAGGECPGTGSFLMGSKIGAFSLPFSLLLSLSFCPSNLVHPLSLSSVNLQGIKTARPRASGSSSLAQFSYYSLNMYKEPGTMSTEMNKQDCP